MYSELTESNFADVLFYKINFIFYDSKWAPFGETKQTFIFIEHEKRWLIISPKISQLIFSFGQPKPIKANLSKFSSSLPGIDIVNGSRHKIDHHVNHFYSMLNNRRTLYTHFFFLLSIINFNWEWKFFTCTKKFIKYSWRWTIFPGK